MDRATGGGSGRWTGLGRVYVMTYTENRENNYKIGCTSKAPEERLKEIQTNEQNKNITLVGSVKANEMRGAETAGQQAAVLQGLTKDPSRGRATDWFVGSLTQREVLDAVRQGVYKHNAKNK